MCLWSMKPHCQFFEGMQCMQALKSKLEWQNQEPLQREKDETMLSTSLRTIHFRVALMSSLDAPRSSSYGEAWWRWPGSSTSLWQIMALGRLLEILQLHWCSMWCTSWSRNRKGWEVPTPHFTLSPSFSLWKKKHQKNTSYDRPTKIPQTRLEPAEFSFPPSTLAFPLFFCDCTLCNPSMPQPKQRSKRRPETCPKSLVSATRPCLAIPVASSSRVPWLLRRFPPFLKQKQGI